MPESDKAPNLLLIVCDELRAFEVGCYGHPTVRTPHLDALADRGVRVETAISNAPVCMPARSVMLSGQHARTCCGSLTNAGWPGDLPFNVVGFPQWPTGRRVHLPDQTLPERLREAGYRTAAVGKWHVEAWPDAIGFDHYVIPAHHHAHTAQWFIEDGQPPFSPPGYSVDFEAERVSGYLREHAGGEQPFFMYYNISPPHMPLADAPRKYREMYGRDDAPVRPNVDLSRPLPDQEERFKTYLHDYRYYRDHLPHTETLPEGLDLVSLTAMYLGLVTWVDDTVGRVLAALDAAGSKRETLVVFTSDHGENLGSHGRMGKGSLNEEATRVPMIAAGTGLPAGAVSGRVASLVDLPATLLGAAGVETPGHFQGRSCWGDWVAPVAEPSAEDAGLAFIETHGNGVGVRSATHALGVRYAQGDPGPVRHQLEETPHRFFDLRNDPYEINNLAERAAEDPIGRRLEAALRRWHAET
ncbi:MAG: sulfatase-like hydrolase/transferase [Planctomycetota bacterium]